MKNALYVKLFAGEFGFELMRWQGCIRYIAKDYDFVVIECKEGHELLYEDFANCIIRYKIIKANIVNCSLFKGQTQRLDKLPDLSNFNVKTIKPCIEICDQQIKQIFVPFGKQNTEIKYDIIIHARNDNRPVKHGDRNWLIQNWINLVSLLKNKRIASIGTDSASFHIPGSDDLRNISLKKLANILCNGKLCIGPSSGPMHLASLCKCPHIVWTIEGKKFMKAGPKRNAETSRERYERSWNIFNTKAIVIDESGWQPSVKTVLSYIIKEL